MIRRACLSEAGRSMRRHAGEQQKHFIVNQSCSHALIYQSLTLLLAVAERWIEMDWMNATMLCATLLVVGAVFYITSLEMRNR